MESIGQGKGDGLESSRGKEKKKVAETHPGSRAIQKDSELQSQPVGAEGNLSSEPGLVMAKGGGAGAVAGPLPGHAHTAWLVNVARWTGTWARVGALHVPISPSPAPTGHQ